MSRSYKKNVFSRCKASKSYIRIEVRRDRRILNRDLTNPDNWDLVYKDRHPQDGIIKAYYVKPPTLNECEIEKYKLKLKNGGVLPTWVKDWPCWNETKGIIRSRYIYQGCSCYNNPFGYYQRTRRK